jgi:hypothetical protein
MIHTEGIIQKGQELLKKAELMYNISLSEYRLIQLNMNTMDLEERRHNEALDSFYSKEIVRLKRQIKQPS